MSTWFDVDRQGLAKLFEKRGKVFALYELVQNAWDTGAKLVHVRLEKDQSKPWAYLSVEDDDPNGFVDLTHAYTLFAESIKKNDPTKRGRFNFGEKLVLALCKTAKVESTTGTIEFNEDGTRTKSSKKRERGSVFSATLKMNNEEFEETRNQFRLLIPPAGVATYFNGEGLKARKPVAVFEAQLPTVGADGDGNLFKTRRKTEVAVYEPDPGETPSIYELGIPVVEIGDRFHVNVMQKVPVNLDRENVPPPYLRQLRALVLNATKHLLDETAASENWVTDAMSHPDVAPEAVESVLTKRFGEKRAIYDGNDIEANNRLMSQGYTIIPKRAFGGEAWKNIRSSGAAQNSGVIAPTPKPYSDDPDATTVKKLPEEEWTPAIKRVVALTKDLGHELMSIDVQVVVVKDAGRHFSACYGNRTMQFNLQGLTGGKKWFELWHAAPERVLDLIVHEFGHEFESNHLSERYHEALTRLAGKLAVLALKMPEVFKP